MAALERAVGRRFDVIHRYHDIDGEIPDATERAQVAQGQLLHIAIAARDYQQGNQPPVTWAAIADGQYDASLRRQAQGIASLKVPTFVTFEQEADQKDKLGVRGSAAEFIAAWRHIHDVYRASGATNAIWVWGMTGIEQNLDRVGSLWPGNEYVDWISWDVYNQSGCHSQRIRADRYISFADQTLVFYNWLHEHGAEYGIDATKPMMLGEVGSSIYPDDPSRTAEWYEAIPDFLRDHQQIKAVGLWQSHTDRCDYRFSRNPVVLQGVSEAGKDAWVDYWHGEPAKALP